MTRNDIGSEFCNELYSNPAPDSEFDFNLNDQSVFLLSGRTAIDFCIKDIQVSIGAFSVCIPSYCCSSMIEPFVRNHCRISFYSVVSEKGELVFPTIESEQADVFLIMEYFGYRDGKLSSITNNLKKKGKIVILDQTQSFFAAPDSYSLFWNYRFVSFRKWFYSNCCLLQKQKPFAINNPSKQNFQYLQLRNKANGLKSDYLQGLSVDKTAFLERFKKAEVVLEEDYQEYSADSESVEKLPKINIDLMISERKQNSLFLAGELQGLSDEIRLMFDPSIHNKDSVPLFVPLFCKSKEIRDLLKGYLIKQNIYCPIHWPIPNEVDALSFSTWIYDHELSLICDQRYGEKDMQREIDCLFKFYRKEN